MSIMSVKFLKDAKMGEALLCKNKTLWKVRGYGNNLVLGLFNDVISNSDHIALSDWMVVH